MATTQTTSDHTPGQVCIVDKADGQELVTVTAVHDDGRRDVRTVDGATITVIPDELAPCPLSARTALLVGKLLTRRVAEEATTSALKEKIQSMRDYAITKYREGFYCRDGLNDFLRTHNLAEFHGRYRAQLAVELEVTFDEEVDERDDERLTALIAEEVGVTTSSLIEIADSRVRVTGLSTVDG